MIDRTSLFSTAVDNVSWDAVKSFYKDVEGLSLKKKLRYNNDKDCWEIAGFEIAVFPRSSKIIMEGTFTYDLARELKDTLGHNADFEYDCDMAPVYTSLCGCEMEENAAIALLGESRVKAEKDKRINELLSSKKVDELRIARCIVPRAEIVLCCNLIEKHTARKAS